eukprot:SAG31_NODE_602_length_13638_cov_32.936037_7_plen_216_part_00
MSSLFFAVNVLRDPLRASIVAIVFASTLVFWRHTPAHQRPEFLRKAVQYCQNAARQLVRIVACQIGPLTAEGSGKAQPAAYAASVALLIPVLAVCVSASVRLWWVVVGVLLCLLHSLTRSPNTNSKVEPTALAQITLCVQVTRAHIVRSNLLLRQSAPRNERCSLHFGSHTLVVAARLGQVIDSTERSVRGCDAFPCIWFVCKCDHCFIAFVVIS